MNQNADEYTTYKLIYIARHGEGYHNLVCRRILTGWS